MANTITDKVIRTTAIGGMHFMGWRDLFPELNRPEHRRNRKRSLVNAEWYRLKYDTHFEGYEFKAGSLFKFWETQNFGWVAFHPSSVTPEGDIPGKLIFKY